MIQFENVTLRYKKQTALDNISFTLKKDAVCGVLGRNGAGKTSMLALIAAYRRPSAGTVRAFGENPYENPRVIPQISFVFDKNEENNGLPAGEILNIHAAFRPNWDKEYARKLIDRFDIQLKKPMSGLSRGQQAAVRAVAGLASRAPISIYDEAYLGMDAAYRKLFVSELLEDYAQNPRAILFSTHYIDEMGGLFDEAIILDNGRVIAHENCDALRQKGVAVIGPAAAADDFTRGRDVLSERSLGAQKERVLFGALTEAERAAAERAGLTLQNLSLQDLFIYMTEKNSEKFSENKSEKNSEKKSGIRRERL
jgi:ABC-2 type transport system ATP-binding protein